jgi:hypothetical protein
MKHMHQYLHGSDGRYNIKEVQLGRRKAEALVKKVLGPHALNENLRELKPSTNDVIFFGIQTDASYFKNKKYFPTTVQYYNPKMGIINKIIDFKENPDETAWGMERSIIQTFDKLQLDVKFKRGQLCQ